MNQELIDKYLIRIASMYNECEELKHHWANTNRIFILEGKISIYKRVIVDLEKQK